MKITPDASLFQALSSFPRVNREAINPTPNQDKGNTPRVTPEDHSRQTARQEAIRQKRAELERTQQSNAADFSSQITPDSKRSANPYNREAPGVDQRPAFRRLGQIIDIKV